MNIEQLTIKEFKELSAFIGSVKQRPFPHQVGDQVFIRTVTLYYTGKIKELCGEWIVLEQASWIADTGRFHDFLKDGKCNEYESFVDLVSIPKGSIIDITNWSHKLFSGQK